MTKQNDNLILVVGKSAAGKSMCLKDIKGHEGVMYLNCESGKKLPFKNKFKRLTITDPYMVFQAFQKAEEMPEIHTIVIDSLTYLMDLFESLYVVPKAGTKQGMQAWSDYAQFFKALMQQYVAASTKNVIMTAHTADEVNDDMIKETLVKIKGSVMNNGVESYFSQIVACKKMQIKQLDGYESDLLNITDRETRLKHKYVFQTDLTADTINERIRGPYGMWEENEIFIDNNIQLVLDRIHEYYDEE